MPQSIRVSDAFYAMAEAASAVSCRSLAQQMEYWARLGAALDAAGLTSEQASRILNGDADLKRQVLAMLAASSGPEDVGGRIAARRAKDKDAVQAGRQSPESLLVIPGRWVQKARFTFPEEPSSKDGW